MESLVLSGHGIHFALCMKHDKSTGTDYSYHQRSDQPCYGELRKYKSTHGDECTQPDNRKPGDLHHEFPDGIPYLVGTRFSFTPTVETDRLFQAVFLSTKSPWKKGLDDPRVVSENGHSVGLIMGCSVDPTVMVSAFNFFKSKYMDAKSFARLVDLGMKKEYALAVLLLNGGGGQSVFDKIAPTYDYYFPAVFSARRFFNQEPKDLSNGLFKDRVDYNRTLLQDVFRSDKSEKGLVWAKACKQSGIVKGEINPYDLKKSHLKDEELVEKITKMFDEALANDIPLPQAIGSEAPITTINVEKAA